MTAPHEPTRHTRKILRERDAMMCRSCNNEERASEGYPCNNCGTFICIICTFRGVEYCRKCEQERANPQAKRSA
jgi:hypothetical protein